MTDKKYVLTDDTIKVGEQTLYRIEALRDFANIKKGDKGGYVRNEHNLSHKGDCWVYDNAKVYDYARIFGNARAFNNAEVYDDAIVFGSSCVVDNSRVFGDAQIFGDARICSNAKIFGKASIYGFARIGSRAQIYDEAAITGNAIIIDDTKICGESYITDNSIIGGHSIIDGEMNIRGYASIYDAEVNSASDYIVFNSWWSDGHYFTWTRSNNMWNVGRFHGIGEELIAKAYKESELSGREYERVVRYVESIYEQTK